MLSLVNELWDTIVSCYHLYSGFIHSIFPSATGDLVEGLLDIIVAVFIVKMLSDFAFTTKTKEF